MPAVPANGAPQPDPNFQPPVTTPFGLINVGDFAAPTFADIDGDSDLDAFIGNRAGNTLFYRNTGSSSFPAFAAPTENPFGLTNVGVSAKPVFADIDGDGDGDLDAFVGNSQSNTRFYRNTGIHESPVLSSLRLLPITPLG